MFSIFPQAGVKSFHPSLQGDLADPKICNANEQSS